MQTLNKRSLFWDVDISRLSSEHDWFFIIERILEFGDIDDLIWMKNTFTTKQIRDTVQKSRTLSHRVISFCKASGYAS